VVKKEEEKSGIQKMVTSIEKEFLITNFELKLIF